MGSHKGGNILLDDEDEEEDIVGIDENLDGIDEDDELREDEMVS